MDGSQPLCCHQRDLSAHRGKLNAEADVLVSSFPVAPALSPLLQINRSAALLKKARGPAGSPARTPILGWPVAQSDAPPPPGCPDTS